MIPSTLTDTFSKPIEWLIANTEALLYAGIFILAVFVGYKLFEGQVKKWESRGLDENASFIVLRFFRWIAYAAVAVYLIHNFGFKLDSIASILAVAGGTVIGFASMNTLGNAISGLIIMGSRPFKIGDLVYYNNQFAEITSVDLIYTKMKTLDNITISVPNQLLLQTSVTNYGKTGNTRRTIVVTKSAKEDSGELEKGLVEAAQAVEGILVDPKPCVQITNFDDKGIEYTLYYYITDMRKLSQIEADLRREIVARHIL